MTYRKDIQAFRAVAVILVMAAHFEIPGFNSGFIGVDIFFVISGFVITKLIDYEKSTTASFDYLHFYARRFNRLAPSFLAMICVFLVFNYFLNAPSDQLPQLLNSVASVCWVSNIQLAFENVEYFNLGAKNNALLHSWSLGVEEQFYIVWPLIFMFFYPLSHTKRYISLVGLLLVSFSLSTWLSFATPAYAYYLMPTRMWQFLFGALVFLLFEKSQYLKLIKFDMVWVHLLGWVILGFSLYWIDAARSYPGFQAVLPTIAIALLLLSGQGGAGVKKIYGLSFLRWVGDRSYSLYLWHWPYWYFINSFPISSIFVKVSIASTLTTLTAALLYKFLENPIRRKITLNWSVKKTAVFALSSMLIYLVFFNSLFQRASDEVMNANVADIGRYMTDLPSNYKVNCDTEIFQDDVRPCLSGAQDSTKKIVVLGDSIGMQWLPAIENIYGNKWSITSYTKSACTLVNKPIYYEKIGRRYTECEIWREKALNSIVLDSPDIIFMGSGIVNLSHGDWVDGLVSTIDRLKKTNAQIYIFRPTPKLVSHPLQCLKREAWIARFVQVDSLCDFIGETDGTTNREVYSYLLEVKNKYRNVHILDMNELICNQGRCRIKLPNVVSYRDQQHLTASFVSRLAPKVNEVINKPEDMEFN